MISPYSKDFILFFSRNKDLSLCYDVKLFVITLSKVSYDFN